MEFFGLAQPDLHQEVKEGLPTTKIPKLLGYSLGISFRIKGKYDLSILSMWSIFRRNTYPVGVSFQILSKNV